jgi:hypothetical protein
MQLVVWDRLIYIFHEDNCSKLIESENSMLNSTFFDDVGNDSIFCSTQCITPAE